MKPLAFILLSLLVGCTSVEQLRAYEPDMQGNLSSSTEATRLVQCVANKWLDDVPETAVVPGPNVFDIRATDRTFALALLHVDVLGERSRYQYRQIAGAPGLLRRAVQSCVEGIAK